MTNFFQILLNLATTTTTTEPPTGIPTYAPVAQLYDRTTDYHWPKFSDNATKTDAPDGPGKWSIGDGPFGFGNSIKLEDDTVYFMGFKGSRTFDRWTISRRYIWQTDI